MTHGREAAGKLLVELQVRKSTADGPGARQFYTELTTPFPGWEGEVRDLALRKKLVRHRLPPVYGFISKYVIHFQPRKVFCQPNTLIVNGEVVLKEYPLTPIGVIESFIERKL